MTEPRAEIRRRIVRRLNTAHAEDVADAVMELFPDVEVAREYRRPGFAVSTDGPDWGPFTTHTRFVLRTAPEPIEETHR